MRKSPLVDVVFFHRKPAPVGTYSIEFIFDDVRTRLSGKIRSSVRVSKYLSQGAYKRAFNTLEAAWRARGKIAHMTGDTHYLVLLMNKNRTLLTIHDCGFMNEERSALAKEIYRLFWLKFPVARSGLVSANSDVTKADIVRYTGCDPEKIHVIPVAISQNYQPAPKNFNAQKPHFLFIGSSANKNLERTIDALEDIPCTLTIIGNLPDDHRARLVEKGVDFRNLQNLSDEEMLNAYQECDALLFPSTFEGFGMPILEAQSVGRPVLTANVASMPFVAKDAAILVDPFSVDSIRQGIERLLSSEDLPKELVQRGFENVKRFDPQNIAEQYLELYQTLNQR